ncbi:glycosyltransferase involved in cell wall biosynthesis [Gelidibacter algens]|uniref:Glycosyltransferase involved in cell wall biosynthesis n=2 Tax=Gelidibacter algens TaxID=49280 RepID=A0A327S6S6_9FLAO|nr:glycosyltransferase involved in cell wall biosynthesis [Gelidibacter algens]
MQNISLKKSFNSQRMKRRLKNQIAKSTETPKEVASILMLTTFPPRECGIATYSQDLKKSVENAFGDSCKIEICALYNTKHQLESAADFIYSLNTDSSESYQTLTAKINADDTIKLVMIQHEFGLFNGCSDAFIGFLKSLKKPLIVAFHTVIPNPDEDFIHHVTAIAASAKCLTVMTNTSKSILVATYGIAPSKIEVINHGTHLIRHKNKSKLKSKYGLKDKTVLSTFGLLGPGKSIETTLEALPEIIKEFPKVMFLILGKTHPTLVKNEGEIYREFLVKKINDLKIGSHVTFVNEFVPLETLLEYLQLTDVYLFTSKDPNQAVSGTFAYAMSCGCPIISTPIPHAKEVLSENKGLLFDFENSKMLTKHLRTLLNDKQHRKNLGLNGLHASASTSWQNSALAHGNLFQKFAPKIKLVFNKPEIKLQHLYRMTTTVGLIQFAKLNQPDIQSGYTLDDNARALIVICEAFKLTRDEALIPSMILYFNFIVKCHRHDGLFLNYVDKNKKFTSQNELVNLEDSNGRAIWAVGHLLEVEELFPETYDYIFDRARDCFGDFLPNGDRFNSPRAMAFIIKGIKTSGLATPDSNYYNSILKLGSKLLNMYKHESRKDWKWFESYLTYGNSVLPEAMLEVYKITQIEDYKITAIESFNFLLQHLFVDHEFKVISNQTWFLRGDSLKECSLGGQQPIDVAYTILALKNFNEMFPSKGYEDKMELAFSWFMGNNHLNQIIYNPCTTGCYDGLELNNVNLNQGAESTISYLLARLAFEEYP